MSPQTGTEMTSTPPWGGGAGQLEGKVQNKPKRCTPASVGWGLHNHTCACLTRNRGHLSSPEPAIATSNQRQVTVCPGAGPQSVQQGTSRAFRWKHTWSARRKPPDGHTDPGHYGRRWARGKQHMDGHKEKKEEKVPDDRQPPPDEGPLSKKA